MNKFKAIKSYTLYIVLIVCSFAFWYLGIAFVLLDLDFVNWQEGARILLFINGTLTSICTIYATKVTKS